jgi:hypothetical protein
MGGFVTQKSTIGAALFTRPWWVLMSIKRHPIRLKLDSISSIGKLLLSAQST